jgi:hypothetical protein
VLIGVPDYQSPELPAIPAVRENLGALHEAMTAGDHGLLPPGNCRILGTDGDAVSLASVGAELISAGSEATDLLLVYYAGHGVLDDDGLLHLALADTNPESVGFSAIPFNLVKRELSRARAKARVLLLDCCFSGRAFAAMAAPSSLVSGQLDLNGTYILTSTTATAPSYAPPGARHTAFTEALLSALAQPEALTLNGIYEHVDRELTTRGLPPPQARSVNAANDLVLVRGRTPKDPTKFASTVLPGPAEVRFVNDTMLIKRIGYAAVGVAFTAVVAACGYQAASVDSWGARVGAILFGLMMLLIPYGAFGMAFEKPMTLVVDASGLEVRRNGARTHIPWEHVSYVGVLNRFSFGTSGGGTINQVNLLVVRLWQHAPSSRYRAALPSNSEAIQRLGYIGVCTLNDLKADPVWLRQAVERLSPCPYHPDSELRAMDPRLAAR